MKHLIVLLLFVSACAGKAPPSLSPAGVRIWQADQAAVAIGTVQHVAIGLNAVAVCDQSVPRVCHPLLSNINTRVVIDAVEDGLKTLQATPEGWKAITLAALDRVDARLDAAGKSQLTFYTAAARELLNGGL